MTERRRHYIKLLDPSFWEEGHRDNPKGRISPGEGLVKMVRVLLGRPAGGAAPRAREEPQCWGRGREERALAGIRVCRQGAAGTG